MCNDHMTEHTDRLAGRLREIAGRIRQGFDVSADDIEGIADAIASLPKASPSRWLDDALNSGDGVYRP